MTDDDVRSLVDDPALRRDVSAVEVAAALLERLEDAQPRLRVATTITAELALGDARRVDAARAHRKPLPLDGMPLVVKDNVDVAGVATTVGSRLFAGHVARADAEVVRRLRAVGGVILAKANMHELAFGGTSRNETFGHVLNPAAPTRIPGGSSGGSASAVAADLCVGAIGTDTGGSVRLPASLCGVTGLRPTFGAVSTRGVRPVSASLDTVGPLARAARDVRDLLAAVAGHDPHDPTSVDRELDLDLGDRPLLAGLSVGVVEELVGRSDASVAARVLSFADLLAELGASVVPLELSGWEHAADVCGQLIKAEALAVYRDALAASPELLEEGTRRRLELVRDLTAADVDALRAERVRWTRTVERAFESLDVAILPTVPIPAPSAAGADSVETTAAIAPHTHALSLAHVPSISLPCGWADSAPVGVQLATTRWSDGRLLRVAALVQEHAGWHRERAPHAGSIRTTS